MTTVAPPDRPLRVPKAEQSRRTRELLIQTGIRCLAEYGYSQTTLLLIANEAGVSRGPLHYHFRDKNDLMAAIAAALPRRVAPEVRARLETLTDPIERFASVIDVALEGHTGHHHFAAMELLMAARNDPQLADAIGPHLDEAEAATDAWWMEYMAGLDLPGEELLALRHVAVACLRGLALDHILHQDREAHARAGEMFRAIFMAQANRSRTKA
jgi:AcrR family transcriptional regulator